MKTLIFFILLGFLLYGQKKQVCFSFDDLPVVSYGISDTTFQKNLFEKLIYALKENDIPAIGFVNEKKLYSQDKIIQFKVELLKQWVNNNLDLGNHTFSHPDYNLVSFGDYTQDLLKGETITKKILSNKGKTIRYFRNPFLHMGSTKEKADSLDNFLLIHGYRPAPVTIDNEDYLFAVAYKRVKIKKDSLLISRIGYDYINYMEKKLKYYEMQSNHLFGRNIKQILLLHASWLNSDYVDSLAAKFRKNNYEFITLDQALEDNIYKTDINVYGTWGISWIDRWGLSIGKKGDFFKDEPVTPDYIKELSK
ncbi:MAG: polysaccharide deacetylase family protein [Ignavibacteriaceae bacterium]